jgi:SAM-dependent methyltransferase
VNLFRSTNYRTAMTQALGREPWCVDHVSIAGDAIEIRGWAIPPGGETAKVDFRIDGEPFAEVSYPVPRPDIERLFWYVPNALHTGFMCRTHLTRREKDILTPYVLSYVDKRTGGHINPLHDYFCYYTPEDRFAFPPPQNRRRVHGSEDESAFRLEGYSTFQKLRRVLKERMGRDFGDFKSILDWGCGCGRMTRYFHWLPGVRVTGIDIDAGNVEWCRANLGFGSFATVPLHPPTPLAADSFELLIGISIFTHLLEPETHEWLRELRRIAMPGAVLLMTIHSDATAARSSIPEPMWNQWKKTGFVDAGANPDLEGAMSVQEYYRNTFFTHEYVRAKWSQYFEIVDIVPGYIGNHQDLVVMRRARG